ncbi:MAG TPA: NAD-dependent epimerase/dehydratase family protein, partial [Candidatus Dormibacteraeota bacterium]|nr:NAD-dependent epimerase/dehydratase family protein [Candidatus Dormibacteraeota bacterium]
SGFLGSWICDILVGSGARVLCVDNLSTGVFENVDHLRGEKGFKFEKADVCKYSRNPSVDMIFHLASRPAPEDYQKHPVETALANSTGTDRMLDLARKNDARVFYVSSSEVYGDPDVFPTPESNAGRVRPLGPRACYEEGKRFGETLCKAYHDEYGLDVRIARLFNSYGPRLRAEGAYSRVISRFVQQALRGEEITVFGDGTQTRSFCYVTDTISGSLLFIGLDQAAESVLNIGTEHEVKIIDLVEPIRKLTGSRSAVRFLPFPAGDHMRRLPDTARAKKLLGWRPLVQLEVGLERTLNWFRSKKFS